MDTMVMAKLPGEKSFGAELPISLAERFAEQCDAMDCKKKTAIRAAIKLWVELPADVRVKLLDQSLDGATFVELVQRIVDERIAAGNRAGEAIAARRPHKPNPKG
ncbi:MAG TPA: hypothetical protein P5296_04645 [Anaerohalosphaeraceae bacterium]|jgi:hypothetical protein|nr:hypothetical protein [Anaerohalosphaeraceae bacterium]